MDTLEEAESFSRVERNREERIKALKRRREVERREELRAVNLDTTNSPEWARGCEKCRYGIVLGGIDYSNAPMPLYLLKPILATQKLITYCTCRAGQAARENAIGHLSELKTDETAVTDTVKLHAWIRVKTEEEE